MATTTHRSTARHAADEASHLMHDVAERASDAVDDATEAASRVTERVTERASEIGKKAVDQFNATTQYFREHDVQAMVSDVKSWAKANPAQAMIAAAAVGFLAATLIRRR